MFLNDVFALAQRRRYRHAVRIGCHRSGKAGSILVIVVDIKLNTLNRAAIQFIGFYQFDITLCWFILNRDRIGFSVFIGFDDS